MTGYYGKVSTHGDFVGRGLPAQLVQAWDAWLQEGMRAIQEKLGVAWLERYLNGPVWRFAIAPGVLGMEGLVGVMMPSVDRVGRYFPLMIGAIGGALPADWYCGQAVWYDVIEDLARSSLSKGFLLQELDGAADPVLSCIVPASLHDMRRLGPDENVAVSLSDAMLRGHGIWWTEGGPFVEASLLICRGMPRPGAFVTMFDGVASSV